jgi:hypothetical protein
MTPILIFFFGIKPYLAVGTDLLFAAFTKMGGTVAWRAPAPGPGAWWAPVGWQHSGFAGHAVCAAPLWARPTQPVQHLMTTTLGVALLLTAAATLYKAIRGKPAPRTLPRPGRTGRPPAPPLEPAAAVWRCHRHAGVAHLGGCRRHWRHRADAAVPAPAAAAHRGRRHCLCRAADAGGRPGPCLARLGGLALLAKLLAGSLPGIWLGRAWWPARPSASSAPCCPCCWPMPAPN